MPTIRIHRAEIVLLLTCCLASCTLVFDSSPSISRDGGDLPGDADSPDADSDADSSDAAVDKVWTETACPLFANATELGDMFGNALARSDDGRTIAIGAIGEDSNSTAINTNELINAALESGAVYVFYLDKSDVWQQQAYIKPSNTSMGASFGAVVALDASGDTLVVGAPNEGGGVGGINPNEGGSIAANAGAVYVFRRDSSSSWSQSDYIKASNTSTNDQFGGSLALSDDARTLAVGSVLGEGLTGEPLLNTGAVFVFQADTAGNWTEHSILRASNRDIGDRFGHSLAMSFDGSTIAVGAPNEDSLLPSVPTDNKGDRAGAAYVFTRDTDGNWSQADYLKAQNPDQQDFFGSAIALSSDGTRLAIAARGEDSAAVGVGGNESNNGSTNSGAVFIFSEAAASEWAQEAYLKASNTGLGDNFGYTLWLDATGTTLVVGAPKEDSGSRLIDTDEGDNTALDSGAAYVFAKGGLWSQTTYLKSVGSGAGYEFGTSVHVSDDAGEITIGSLAASVAGNVEPGACSALRPLPMNAGHGLVLQFELR